MLAASGLKDAALVQILNTSQSTVSRLRHCKIRKVGKYLEALDESGVCRPDFDACMRDLARAAVSRPSLKQLLEKLHSLMQELRTIP